MRGCENPASTQARIYVLEPREVEIVVLLVPFNPRPSIGDQQGLAEFESESSMYSLSLRGRRSETRSRYLLICDQSRCRSPSSSSENGS